MLSTDLVKKATVAVAFFSFAALPGYCDAQAEARIEKPAVKPGESWTYRRINLHTNAVTETATERVTFAEREVIHVVSVREGATEEADNTFTAEWNMVMSRLRGGSVATPHTGTLNFPLYVGKTYPANYVFEIAQTGRRLRHERVGKVLGWEDVVVPAGRFRALKIELRGPSQRLDAAGTGWTHTVVWYVPEVKRWVKVQFEDAAGNKGMEELLRFQVQ